MAGRYQVGFQIISATPVTLQCDQNRVMVITAKDPLPLSCLPAAATLNCSRYGTYKTISKLYTV